MHGKWMVALVIYFNCNKDIWVDVLINFLSGFV